MARTLGVLGVVAMTMFIGVSYLAVETHARPSTTDSVVSQVARAILPAGSANIVLLARPDLHVRRAHPRREHVVPGFPRLSALLAHDRFIPRQVTNLGDRLVFSNGVIVLAGAAAFLIWIYHANVNNLIHLYVIGVFTAFTLSQTGMVRYWLRTHGDGWRWRAPVNGVGAVATCVVAIVVILTKFGEGAWIVTVAVPLMVVAFYGVRRHYEGLQRRLSAGAAAVAAAPAAHNRTLVVVESLDEATEAAAWLADKISPGGFRAIHVPVRGSDPGIRPRWLRGTWGQAAARGPRGSARPDCGPARRGLAPAAQRVRVRDRGPPRAVRQADADRAVPTPARAQVEAAAALGAGRRRCRRPGRAWPEADLPERLVARVLVSGVNAATMRAANYASTLHIGDTQGVHFAFNAEDARAIRSEWAAQGPRVSLHVEEAPYRDIGAPLLRHLRGLTEDPDVAVLVLMPELITRGWRRVFHNQRALYIKRLLLFERHVILASVPYQLLR